MPILYPNGIMQALLISRSPDTHILLIGLDPWKNVAHGLCPVCCMTASHRSYPSLSPSSFPMGPFFTYSLWSINKIILSSDACHCLICLTRCLQNKMRGRVRSFFFVMKYRRCCWFDIPEFTFLFLHGLYAVMIHVLCPLFPPRRTQHYLPSPSSSLPIFLMYLTESPKQLVPVPPSCTLPAHFASWTL